MSTLLKRIILLAFATLLGATAHSQPADFSNRLARAKDAFSSNRDYNTSATDFAELLANSPSQSAREEVRGYLNAAYYSIGKHVEALSLICSEHRRAPSTDRLWIFDIHAHARRIALAEGYERAIAAMTTKRVECGLADFSPFWVAIPLAKMEYLKAGIHVLSESYVLPQKDKIVLQQLLKRFPADPYIDYARYFLLDFDSIARPELIALRKSDSLPAISAARPISEDTYVQARLQQAPSVERQQLSEIVDKGACSSPTVGSDAQPSHGPHRM